MSEIRLAMIGDMHLKSEESFALFEVVLERVEEDNPDRLILLGDMTNDGEPEFVERIATTLSRFPVPYTIVPGNHDLGNVGEYDRLTRFFGGFEGDGPLTGSFDLGEYQGIVLDTNNTIPDKDQWHGYVEEPGMRALEAELSRAGTDRPILLFGHAGLAGKPEELTLDVGNADDVLDRLDGCNLRAAFHGHAHILRIHRRGDVPFIFVPHMQHTPGFLSCVIENDVFHMSYHLVAIGKGFPE